MDGFIFRKTREVETELSTKEMGETFANADSMKQVAFLNAAFNLMASWPDARGAFQLSYIAEDGGLSPASKNALRELVAHFDEES